MEENLFGRESKPAGKDKTKMISCRRDGRRSKKTDLSRRRDVFFGSAIGGTGSQGIASRENAFTDSTDNAVELMRRIDALFPSPAKPRK